MSFSGFYVEYSGMFNQFFPMQNLPSEYWKVAEANK